MKNLISNLSQSLQNKLSDYKVDLIFVEEGELNIRSQYDMDPSFYQAIEMELKELGCL